VRIWQAQGMCYEEMSRPREAIECLKRALLGADPHEVQIHLKLGKLHDEIEDYPTAASYHQRVVEVSQASGRPIHTYAKSCIYVAKHHMERGGKDLALARACLEKVAASNAEEVAVATELLKKLTSTMDSVPAEARPMEATLDPPVPVPSVPICNAPPPSPA